MAPTRLMAQLVLRMRPLTHASRAQCHTSNHTALRLVKPKRRHFTNISPRLRPEASAAADPKATKAANRAARVIARLPPSLQKYARRLQNAPVSHVVAFLFLHEITAIVPLVGLAALFHYYLDTSRPVAWMSKHYGTYLEQGMQRFERYFRRKGWFGFSQEDEPAASVNADPTAKLGAEGAEVATTKQAENQDTLRAWMAGDAKYRIVAEVALSWAIVKVLLPARIVVSLWATPWFARLPSRFRQVFGRRKS